MLPAHAYAAAARRYNECRDLDLIFGEMMALPDAQAPRRRVFVDIMGLKDARIQFERMLYRNLPDPDIRRSYLQRIADHMAKGEGSFRMRLILASDAMDHGDLIQARAVLEALLSDVEKAERSRPYFWRWTKHKGLRFFQLLFRHVLPVGTVRDCDTEPVETKRWERSVLFQLLHLDFLEPAKAVHAVSYARRIRASLEKKYDAGEKQEDTVTKYALCNLYLTLFHCRALAASCSMPAVKAANQKIIAEVSKILSDQDLWNAW
jgi:hypothetical protein